MQKHNKLYTVYVYIYFLIKRCNKKYHCNICSHPANICCNQPNITSYPSNICSYPANICIFIQAIFLVTKPIFAVILPIIVVIQPIFKFTQPIFAYPCSQYLSSSQGGTCRVVVMVQNIFVASELPKVTFNQHYHI